jgi:large subunit ribosomal protein L22
MQQEAVAVLKDAPISAQKTRLLADLIRRKPVRDAVELLNFMPKKAAKILRKVVVSAVANAEHNTLLGAEDLIVSTVFVDQARSLRRHRQRAKGRVNVITKRRCHITVKVTENEE